MECHPWQRQCVEETPDFYLAASTEVPREGLRGYRVQAKDSIETASGNIERPNPQELLNH